MAITPIEMEVRYVSEEDGSWLFIKGQGHAIGKVTKCLKPVEPDKYELQFTVIAPSKDGFLMVK